MVKWSMKRSFDFKELLASPCKCVLTLHRKPDGDSIGSNLALYQLLVLKGFQVDIFSKDPIPETFVFLKNADKVKIKNPTEIVWSQYDLYISLDISSPDMLGEVVAFPESLKIVVIDHHVTNIGWGTENIVDTKNISVASHLYRLLTESDAEHFIDKDMATCLLVGLLTDSGFFAYITSPEPLNIAAKLIEKGVNYQDLVFRIQNQKNIEDLTFLSKALDSIRIEKNAVFLPVSNEVWENYGTATDKNHLLTDYIRSIKNTDFGVVIIEEFPVVFRLEFRSRTPGFDVSRIAKKLGGGGHTAAAGATIKDSSFAEIIQKIGTELQ
jgi:phosphoesterase RecJ-like protein